MKELQSIPAPIREAYKKAESASPKEKEYAAQKGKEYMEDSIYLSNVWKKLQILVDKKELKMDGALVMMQALKMKFSEKK